MNKLLLLIAMAMVIFSCQNNADSSATSADESNTAETMAVPPEKTPTSGFENPIDFELICEEQAEPAKETGQPYYKLYVKSALLKEPVFVRDLFGCMQVPKEDYRKLQMISISNGAVNGWYAGGGPLIYAYIEDLNEIVLMKYDQEESVADAHAGHDHAHDHSHEGHDHAHDHGPELEYEEFMRIIVNKDGTYTSKSR